VLEEKACPSCSDRMHRTWGRHWRCPKCGHFELDEVDGAPPRPIFDRCASWIERQQREDEWRDAMSRWRRGGGK
jgi:hypothetical protein